MYHSKIQISIFKSIYLNQVTTLYIYPVPVDSYFIFIHHLTPQGMRNFRKAIATLSVVAILSSLVVSTAFAGTFGDVPADAYYFNAVEELAYQGIIDSTKTNFDPARQLQRQEAAKLIVESAGLMADVPAVGHFTDVPNTLWSYDSVETAFANGVVNGYSDASGNLTGKFGPTDTVTRAQFAKMVVEAFDLPMYTPATPTFPDVQDTNAWYYEYVETAAYHGIVKGYADGSFGANNQIVRQDGAVMIYRALGLESNPGDDDVSDDDVYVPGAIDITLGNTPASSVVPSTATRVPYLVMDVEGTGTLKSLTIERIGAGDTTDFANVYLYDGDTRLTTGRSLNSSTHRATFTGLNYVVDGMSELTVMADMSGVSGNVNGFRLYEVTSDDDVSFGSVEGELMSISAVTVGRVTVTKGATPSNPKLGEANAKIAEFKLSASSSEAVDVYGITLYQSGDVSRSNISNFVLMQGGVEVASAEEVMSNDTIVLTFDTPFTLAKGDNRNFELYADIGQGARDGDKVRVYLENKVDLYTIGSVYGYGVQVNNASTDVPVGSYDGTLTDYSEVTIEGGQVTISFQGPSIQDYSVNTRDVELMRFNITVQNNVEFRKTNFTFTTNGTETDYTSIELVDVDTGDTLVGPYDPALLSSGVMQSLTDTWTMESGESRTLAFVADVGNFTPIAGETVKIELNVFGGADVKNLDNNTNLTPATDIVPTSAVVGNTHNVLSGSASVSVAGTPSIQTYINGSSNLEMAGFVVRAGAGKDAYLKSLTVEALGVNSCATESDCVLTVSLWDGTTQVGTTKSLSSTNMATFNSLNLKIAKGSSKTLLVKTSLNTLSAPAPVALTTLLFRIPAATDLTLQDVEGNSITPTLSATPLLGPAHNISAAGTVTVIKASNEPNVTDSRIVVAGTSGVTLAKFRLTAANESLKLAKVPVSIGTATKEVTNLYLYDGTTKIAGPVTPSGAGLAIFNTFTQDFVIPKNGNKTLTVMGDLSTTDDAVSGAAIIATLKSSTVDFEVRSAGGANTTIYGNVAGLLDIAGSEMRIRKASLTLSKIDTTGTNILGTSELYKFNVEVTPDRTASIKQLSFDVDNGTSAAISAYKLYKNDVLVGESGGSTDVAAVVDVSTVGTIDTVVVSFNDVVTPGPEELEISGTSNVFTLKATVGAGVLVDESITTTLLVDTALTADGQTLVDGAGAPAITAFLSGDSANFIWSDMSGIPHSATNAGPSTPDWANSYLLKSLSLGSQTLIRK